MSTIYSYRSVLALAWLSLWDEHIATGRINQVIIVPHVSGLSVFVAAEHLSPADVTRKTRLLFHRFLAFERLFSRTRRSSFQDQFSQSAVRSVNVHVLVHTRVSLSIVDCAPCRRNRSVLATSLLRRTHTQLFPSCFRRSLAAAMQRRKGLCGLAFCRTQPSKCRYTQIELPLFVGQSLSLLVSRKFTVRFSFSFGAAFLETSRRQCGDISVSAGSPFAGHSVLICGITRLASSPDFYICFGFYVTQVRTWRNNPSKIFKVFFENQN